MTGAPRTTGRSTRPMRRGRRRGRWGRRCWCCATR